MNGICTEKNNRGESYISVCVYVVFAAMIISVIIYFAGTISMVFSVREKVKLVSDGFIIKNSISIYQNIKKGNDYLEVLSKDELKKSIVEELGLVADGDKLIKKNDNGETLYKLVFEDVYFVQENSLKIVTKIRIIAPVNFNGIVISWIEIPMSINSSFLLKA